MIKFDSENCELSMEGTCPEILSELLGLVHVVYKLLKEKNPITAEVFKRMFLKQAECAFLEADDLMEKIKEKANETDEARNGTINKLEELLILLKGMEHDIKHEKQKDIRTADFTSDEEFRKWFRGGE